MAESFPYEFGKYEIEGELGRGGFGTVYRARDKVLDRQVAIKIMAPELMRDTAWVMHFQEEARLMAWLDHPHIVPVYEINESDGRLFLVMKLIEGTNLATLIKTQGQLAPPLIQTIITQVAAALDYAYEQGIVHRDLKPANILMQGKRVALTDFGLARLFEDNRQGLSQSGGVVGTPAYIAPEIWEENAQGRAGDVYALGCVLYEMATGQVLFQGDSAPSTMFAHFKPPPLPEKLPAGTPAYFLKVIQKAIARTPADRYQSAGEMARALFEIDDGMVAATSSLTPKSCQENRRPGPANPSLTVLAEADTPAAAVGLVAPVGMFAEEAGASVGEPETARPVRVTAAAPKIKKEQGEHITFWRNQAKEAIASQEWQAAAKMVRRWSQLAPSDQEAQREAKRVQTRLQAEEAAAASRPSAPHSEKPPHPRRRRKSMAVVGGISGLFIMTLCAGLFFLVTIGQSVAKEPAAPPLPPQPEMKTLDSQWVPIPYTGSSVASQLEQEVQTTLGRAAVAEILAFRYLNSAFSDLVYAGPLRDSLKNHIDSLQKDGTYQVITLDPYQSQILDIEVISSTMVKVDTCEYWHTATYNLDNQLQAKDEYFQPTPQTLTIELFDTAGGSTWFVTEAVHYNPPAFCNS